MTSTQKAARRVAVYCGSANGNDPAFLAEARKLGAVRHATTGDLVSSPEWVRLRTAIMTKLEPYPDARAAVVAACMEVGAAE